MFAATPPQEFLFDFKSPPARRIALDYTSQAVHDSAVRIEFESREEKVAREIGDRERTKYREWIAGDLRQELATMHGIACNDDDVSQLQARLALAESLRRRVELRRCQLRSIVPNEMPFKQIQKELHVRRICWQGLSYQEACEALERALLKDDAEGLVGDGYYFGRRQVSTLDLIQYQQPSDKQMKEMLEELQPGNVPRRKVEKIELLGKFLEHEQESNVRTLMNEELERELHRRGVHVGTSDSSERFELLFKQGTYKQPYDDVDNTPLSLDEAEQEGASRCMIM